MIALAPRFGRNTQASNPLVIKRYTSYLFPNQTFAAFPSYPHANDTTLIVSKLTANSPKDRRPTEYLGRIGQKERGVEE